MKKNLLSSIFVIGVTLVSLFLLVGCQLEAKVATAAENAGIVYAVDPVDLKLFNAADPSPTNRGVEIDANTARWISLGERYSEDTLTSDRVANANIARWNTMGEHYQTMALDDIELATKAYTARWVSLGQSYSEDTLTSDRVANANIARWNTMGEHYQTMALDDIELATKAYTARWVSLGQSYSEDTLTSDRVANANMTRWNAMGEHYQAMALDDIELAAKAKIAR